ncbi:MAG TPA: hypothetical protein VMI56_22005 [Reyranella sp.]|nr:hypothetical protein [Reyranella sp.]
MRPLVAALALILGAAPALAQETGKEKPGDKEWVFAATPYVWLMGASGSVTAKGQTVDVNAGIADIFGKTDGLIALMQNFEARHDKWTLGLDAIYTRMVMSPTVATQRNPVPWLNFSANAGANVTSTLVVLEGTAGYELAKLAPDTALDGLVGLRYWHTSTDMTFGFQATGTIQTPENVGLFSKSIGVAGASSGSIDWADPLVGLRLRHEIAPHHRLMVRGDVGGFGVGSQFTWQALGVYAYEFSSGPTSWSAVIGYRAIGVNDSSGTNSMDLVLHGPVLGVTARW